MRHFRQTHASFQCAKRKQKRTSVVIAYEYPTRYLLEYVGQTERRHEAQSGSFYILTIHIAIVEDTLQPEGMETKK